MTIIHHQHSTLVHTEEESSEVLALFARRAHDVVRRGPRPPQQRHAPARFPRSGRHYVDEVPRERHGRRARARDQNTACMRRSAHVVSQKWNAPSIRLSYSYSFSSSSPPLPASPGLMRASACLLSLRYLVLARSSALRVGASLGGSCRRCRGVMIGVIRRKNKIRKESE